MQASVLVIPAPMVVAQDLAFGFAGPWPLAIVIRKAD
jgi:hypothetical protein